MNVSLKILSVLLSYPSGELIGEIPALKAALAADARLPARAKKLVERLADDIAGLDPYEAQERYVFLFDRTRSLSLHLFEHVHGESRDRGQAMVDLIAMYEDAGFTVGVRELPDYLPLFLEFLALRPEAEARELLVQTLHIVSALRERLKKRRSIYANAFAALEAFAGARPDAVLTRELLKAPEDDPADLQALDQIWEEEAVTFGGNAGEGVCGPDRLRRQIRAAERRPTDPLPTANMEG